MRQSVLPPGLARALAALVLCLLGLPAQALETVTLQLKWVHAFQFAGYYAADAQGYYREAGLDVRFAEAGPDIDVLARVMRGEANYGIGGSNLILDRHAGQPVVALAAIFQHSPLVIIARRDKDMRTVHDLVGKRVMIEGQAEELFAYLQHMGIRRDAFSKQTHDFGVDGLISGKTDALSAYQTYEPFLLDQQGVPYLQFTPRSVGIDFYGDVLFTSAQERERHPERTRAFIDASLRGWQYALDHPQEIIALIRQRYPHRLSEAHLAFEAAQTAPLIRADLVPVGYMNAGRWRHIAETFAAMGMLPANFPLDGFLPPDERDNGWKRLLVPLILTLLALGIISGVAFNTHRLNTRLRQSQRELDTRSKALALQNHVLHLLNRGAPLDEVLDSLTREIETQCPDVLCSILLLEADGVHVRHGSAPSLPVFYTRAINGQAIGDGVGSCGTAAWRNERVIVDDIASHPFWTAFRELAAQAGLQACWSQPFHGRDGKVIGTFALYHRHPASPTVQDITLIENYAQLAELAVEQRLTDDALKLAESRYRLISENASDVIWLLELPSLRFSYVSPSVERLRGWTAEEVIAQPISAALTPESAERVNQALADSLARIAAGQPGPHSRTLEVDQPCKDGRIVPTEVVTTILLDAGGQPVRILGITRDIAERRRNEAALARHRAELESRVEERTLALSIAKEAAEAANRAKSTFLATMSHELRTPMNAILGMTHLASRKATDDLQKDQLDKVTSAANHLLAVINDILDLSRIEADRLTLEHIPFHIGDIASQTRRLTEQLAVDKGLSLKFDLPAEVGQCEAIGDPHRLGQILLNLCGNAIKFTASGSITVRMATQISQRQLTLRCEVEDTGIGIPADSQQRLFDPFVQADGSMSRKYGGTGLGLAICKRLAEMMHGRIGIDSQPGRGSCFWFEVELEAAGTARPPEQAAPEDFEAALTREYAGRSVLLAEDEPINREVISGLLAETGLLVDTAANGLAVVELASQRHYDLILMDMQMPGMNGLDATQIIRCQPSYRDTPIIALTANAFDEDRQRCLDAGMSDHLGKPVNPERLFATLYRWLAKIPVSR